MVQTVQTFRNNKIKSIKFNKNVSMFNYYNQSSTPDQFTDPKLIQAVSVATEVIRQKQLVSIYFIKKNLRNGFDFFYF